MDVRLKPWEGNERLYFYPQSTQIAGQTGLIGRLRSDFGRDGDEFWSTWEDTRGDLKTDEFKGEFDNVIKWGSCSSKGNLNFNCLLMLTPQKVIDSVVVHELCHRKEMNHSDKFYAEVLRVFPEYWTWDKWLKDNGDMLMKRMVANG